MFKCHTIVGSLSKRKYRTVAAYYLKKGELMSFTFSLGEFSLFSKVKCLKEVLLLP